MNSNSAYAACLLLSLQGLKVVADIVINHRCAHYQGDDGKWNKFGGRLAWDKSGECRVGC